MWIAVIIVVILAALAIYEYRLRKPDQLVMYESKGTVQLRTGLLYPRHFSMALPGTTHHIELKIEGIARGGIQITTALVASVAPSREHLAMLVRVGGWKPDAVAKASLEMETLIQGSVRQFTERHLLEELSSRNLSQHLLSSVKAGAREFGLELVSLTVQSIDPADTEIADAMRRRESARILEQTELLNQKARISAARAKLEADEQIALSEHELELRNLDLKKEELEKEAILAERRTEDELKRSRMRLAFEKEEMALLKSSPELLLLSPQAARLAEASQNLKNARTIVSLWPSGTERESGLSGLFQRFLELVLEADSRKRLDSKDQGEAS